MYDSYLLWNRATPQFLPCIRSLPPPLSSSAGSLASTLLQPAPTHLGSSPQVLNCFGSLARNGRLQQFVSSVDGRQRFDTFRRECSPLVTRLCGSSSDVKPPDSHYSTSSLRRPSIPQQNSRTPPGKCRYLKTPEGSLLQTSKWNPPLHGYTTRRFFQRP